MGLSIDLQIDNLDENDSKGYKVSLEVEGITKEQALGLVTVLTDVVKGA
jgi:hypothetical protein